MSNLIKISKLYKALGVCRKTLYNWRDKGILEFVKSPTGFNYVTQETFDTLLKGIKNNEEDVNIQND